MCVCKEMEMCIAFEYHFTAFDRSEHFHRISHSLHLLLLKYVNCVEIGLTWVHLTCTPSSPKLKSKPLLGKKSLALGLHNYTPDIMGQMFAVSTSSGLFLMKTIIMHCFVQRLVNGCPLPNFQCTRVLPDKTNFSQYNNIFMGAPPPTHLIHDRTVPSWSAQIRLLNFLFSFYIPSCVWLSITNRCIIFMASSARQEQF